MATRSKEPKTLQAKFGFLDPDLKKPEHDEIMIELDKNIIRVVARLLDCPEYSEGQDYVWASTEAQVIKWAEGIIDTAREHQNEFLQQGSYNLTVPVIKAIRVDRKWECPITTGTANKYTVGFVDMRAYVYHSPTIELCGQEKETYSSYKRFTKSPK